MVLDSYWQETFYTHYSHCINQSGEKKYFILFICFTLVTLKSEVKWLTFSLLCERESIKARSMTVLYFKSKLLR